MADETIHGQLDDHEGRGARPDIDHEHDGLDDSDESDEAIEAALTESRERLAQVPAAVVVANHAFGLYQLAAIHLSASPARLADAALAIDALACLVEGLSERLGPEAATLADALANIRLAFVQIKSAAG
jgi:hypothetical protein